MRVWPCSNPPVEVEAGEGLPSGEPSTFDFIVGLSWENLLAWGSPASPPLQEQRELLQSLRQTAFESESEAPASNFSTERRRSLCAKEFRKLGFVVRPPWLSLLMLVGHYAAPPFCSLGTAKQLLSCWGSKGKALWLCQEDSAAHRKQQLLKCILSCPPRTTATQQRTSAVRRRDSLPSTTWCISPGTPPTPIAGCVVSPGELPGAGGSPPSFPFLATCP